MNSILNSIKKLLGIEAEDTSFDTDVIININTALMVLNQLGLGPEGGFSIYDSTAMWSDFLEDNKNLEAVKSYVFLKVRLAFDPPSSSAVIESMQRQINELEWRLNVQADTGGD